MLTNIKIEMKAELRMLHLDLGLIMNETSPSLLLRPTLNLSTGMVVACHGRKNATFVSGPEL